MITDEEKLFVNYWEKNSGKEKKLFHMLAFGLPIGLVFALPILLSVLFHDWYKNMVYVSDSEVTIIMIAVMAIAVFYALFRMKFKWEMNDQLYKELKSKERRIEKE